MLSVISTLNIYDPWADAPSDESELDSDDFFLVFGALPPVSPAWGGAYEFSCGKVNIAMNVEIMQFIITKYNFKQNKHNLKQMFIESK